MDSTCCACRRSTAQLWWRNSIPEQCRAVWIPKAEHNLSRLCREKWALQRCFCYLARQTYLNRLVHVPDGHWENRLQDDSLCRRIITRFTFTLINMLTRGHPQQKFLNNPHAPGPLYGWWNVFKAEQIKIRCTLTCTFPLYNAGTESSNNKLSQEARVGFQKLSERQNIHKSSLWWAGLLAQS